MIWPASSIEILIWVKIKFKMFTENDGFCLRCGNVDASLSNHPLVQFGRIPAPYPLQVSRRYLARVYCICWEARKTPGISIAKCIENAMELQQNSVPSCHNPHKFKHSWQLWKTTANYSGTMFSSWTLAKIVFHKSSWIFRHFSTRPVLTKHDASIGYLRLEKQETESSIRKRCNVLASSAATT